MIVSLAKSVEKLVDSCPQKDLGQWPTYSKNAVIAENAKTLLQRTKKETTQQKVDEYAPEKYI